MREMLKLRAFFFGGSKMEKKIAILVDGSFYQKRIHALKDFKTPKESVDFFIQYCKRHVRAEEYDSFSLYRIFYYDCPPSDKEVYHPLLKTAVKLKNTEQYKWMTGFIKELTTRRKVALRLGRLSDNAVAYNLRPDVTKKLLNGKLSIDDITERDFYLSITQKGVDMKLGVDVSSLAYKKQVDKIVLIAGDSDFVPAAKLARREGIDFILDPLWNPINADLHEHIDGLKSCINKNGEKGL